MAVTQAVADRAVPVASALGGDEEALASLLVEHEQRAYNVAYRLLGRDADARDAVQEGFLLALRAVRGDGAPPREIDRFEPWLMRVVANAALGQLRRRPSFQVVPVDERAGALPAREHAEPAHEVERREVRGDVLLALLALPDTQRAALTLREYQELPYEEIGTMLGVNRGAVTQLLFRARHAFRAAYEGLSARQEPVGCAELAPLVSAMIDEELSAKAWSNLKTHLDRCARCRRELNGLRRARRLYALIPLLATPAGWGWGATASAASLAVVAVAPPPAYMTVSGGLFEKLVSLAPAKLAGAGLAATVAAAAVVAGPVLEENSSNAISNAAAIAVGGSPRTRMVTADQGVMEVHWADWADVSPAIAIAPAAEQVLASQEPVPSTLASSADVESAPTPPDGLSPVPVPRGMVPADAPERATSGRPDATSSVTEPAEETVSDEPVEARLHDRPTDAASRAVTQRPPKAPPQRSIRGRQAPVVAPLVEVVSSPRQQEPVPLAEVAPTGRELNGLGVSQVLAQTVQKVPALDGPGLVLPALDVPPGTLPAPEQALADSTSAASVPALPPAPPIVQAKPQQPIQAAPDKAAGKAEVVEKPKAEVGTKAVDGRAKAAQEKAEDKAKADARTARDKVRAAEEKAKTEARAVEERAQAAEKARVKRRANVQATEKAKGDAAANSKSAE